MTTIKMGRAIKGFGLMSTTALTNDQLFKVAPSVFAVDKHESRSDRFAPIPTIAVVDHLRDNGFFPFFAAQSSSRDVTKRDFTKHMLRFRRHDEIATGETVNEIILVNANDGTSSYQMSAGQFRFVCQNGLVMGDIDCTQRVYHKGTKSIQDDVLEGVFEVVNHFEQIAEEKERMQMLTLTDKQKSTFAVVSALKVFGKAPQDLSFNVNDLLRPRRDQDHKNDMWTTFNCIQENIMKGGLSPRSDVKHAKGTRGYNNINSVIQHNNSLWSVAKTLSHGSSFGFDQIKDITHLVEMA